MKNQQLVREYFDGLESGNYEQLLSVFEEEAIVLSPLYGKQSAKDFYSNLFDDTSQSKITLLNTLESNENSNICGGHFRYDWTMKDGSLVTFECVDIFKVSANHKIQQLTIIYDTYGVRDTFEDPK